MRGYQVYKDIWNAALGLKYFACLIFGGKEHGQKFFNGENFSNYSN